MELLTDRDIADELKVSRSWANSLLHQGVMPTYQLGKRGGLRVRRLDFERWLATRREAQRPQTPQEALDRLTERYFGEAR